MYICIFSECGPATCTGKKKECMGDVCKCKRGWKENPEIAKPDGTDDCVEGRNISIISKRASLFLSMQVGKFLLLQKESLFFKWMELAR